MGEVEACWPWLLSVGSHGYGQGFWNDENRTAHSLWFQLETGIRLRGFDFTIHHTCHHKRCCNPCHMEVLSNRTNARDNGWATRTHCPRGHEYTPKNTRIRPGSGPKAWPARWCLACQKIRNDARKVT